MQPPIRKALVGASLLGAVVAGGAVSTFAASTGSDDSSAVVTAADTGDDSSNDTVQPIPAADDMPTPPDPSQGGHTANDITEVLLTGDDATNATEAALAAVPGATVERVETDAEGDAYEAHIVTADGAHQTVKLNADFTVASIEEGPGGPGGPGGHDGAPAVDDSTSTG